MNFPDLSKPNVFIGADHRGHYLRMVVIQLLEHSSYPWIDIGNKEFDEGDDYPDFAEPVAQSVVIGAQGLGILICGTGHGMAIAANKIPGIRAVVCDNPDEARIARLHNHANVLCLPANSVNEELVVPIVLEFLQTKASNVDRHVRRVNKIHRIEQDNA